MVHCHYIGGTEVGHRAQLREFTTLTVKHKYHECSLVISIRNNRIHMLVVCCKGGMPRGKPPVCIGTLSKKHNTLSKGVILVHTFSCMHDAIFFGIDSYITFLLSLGIIIHILFAQFCH